MNETIVAIVSIPYLEHLFLGGAFGFVVGVMSMTIIEPEVSNE